jgi:hypothetical protein
MRCNILYRGLQFVADHVVQKKVLPGILFNGKLPTDFAGSSKIAYSGNSCSPSLHIIGYIFFPTFIRCFNVHPLNTRPLRLFCRFISTFSPSPLSFAFFRFLPYRRLAWSLPPSPAYLNICRPRRFAMVPNEAFLLAYSVTSWSHFSIIFGISLTDHLLR